MKAISLWQPWASAIAAGLKTIETRSWSTPYRGPLAIHAAKRWTAAEQDFLFSRMRGPNAEYFRRIGITRGADVPLGCIVATCEIYGCVSTNDEPPAFHQVMPTEFVWGNFSVNRFAWLLRNIKQVSPCVPCIGRQGFFEFPEQLPGAMGVTGAPQDPTTLPASRPGRAIVGMPGQPDPRCLLCKGRGEYRSDLELGLVRCGCVSADET